MVGPLTCIGEDLFYSAACHFVGPTLDGQSDSCAWSEGLQNLTQWGGALDDPRQKYLYLTVSELAQSSQISDKFNIESEAQGVRFEVTGTGTWSSY